MHFYQASDMHYFYFFTVVRVAFVQNNKCLGRVRREVYDNAL